MATPAPDNYATRMYFKAFDVLYKKLKEEHDNLTAANRFHCLEILTLIHVPKHPSDKSESPSFEQALCYLLSSDNIGCFYLEDEDTYNVYSLSFSEDTYVFGTIAKRTRGPFKFSSQSKDKCPLCKLHGPWKTYHKKYLQHTNFLASYFLRILF